MADSTWRATLVRVGKLLFSGEPSSAGEPAAQPVASQTEQDSEAGQPVAEPPAADAPAEAPPDEEKKPCPTCGSADCPCGDSCTAKGCGCCDGCVTAGEESGDDAQQDPPAEPTAEQTKALADENVRLRAALAVAQRGDRSQAKTERAARISTETDAFMKDNTQKWGMEKRAVFRSLLHGVKLGVVSLRREKSGAASDAPDSERLEELSAKLSADASAILTNLVEALAKSDPGFDQSRITAGGPGVDAEVARASGETPGDTDALRDAKVNARVAADPVKYAGANGYAKAYHDVQAEEAQRGATI